MNCVGAGSGMAMPVFPGGPGDRERFFYFMFLIATILCYLFLRWLYRPSPTRRLLAALWGARAKTPG